MKSQNKLMKKVLTVVLWCAVITALVFSTLQYFGVSFDVQAGYTKTLPFQGRLTNPDGTNVADGSYEMDFRIYDTSNQNSKALPLWTEGHTDSDSVTVEDGVFNVLLGGITAIDLDFNSGTYWLEIQVGGETLSPRRQIGGTGYSINTDNITGMPGSLSDTNLDSFPASERGILDALNYLLSQINSNSGLWTDNGKELSPKIGVSDNVNIDNGWLVVSGTISASTSETINGIDINSGTISDATWNGEQISDNYVVALSGSSQGDVLYHNGTQWTQLAAGVSGRYLMTQGAGADPTWNAISGTISDGTVDSSTLHWDDTGGNWVENTTILTTGTSVYGSGALSVYSTGANLDLETLTSGNVNIDPAAAGTVNVTLANSAGADFSIFQAGEASGFFIAEGDDQQIGIGTTPSYRLDVSDSTADGRGININKTGAGGTTTYGLYSLINSTSTNNYSVFGRATGDTGVTAGVVGEDSGTSTSEHYGGVFYSVGDTGTANKYGVKSYATGTGANAYGIFSYAEDATTAYAAYLEAEDDTPTTNYGVYTTVSAASSQNFGGRFYVDEGGTGSDYGVHASVTTGNAGTNYGGYFGITTGNTSSDYGVYGYIDNAGSGNNSAGYFSINTAGSGTDYGVQASLATPGDGTNYAGYFYLADGGSGSDYGVWTQMTAGGSGSDATIFAQLVDGEGDTDYVAYLDPGSNVEYGLYVDGGATTYSGYFDGSVYASGNFVSGSTITINGTANTISGSTGLAFNTSGAGDLLFSDDNATNIPLTVSDSAINAGLGQGIIDAINDLATGVGGMWLDNAADYLYPNSTYSDNVAIDSGILSVGTTPVVGTTINVRNTGAGFGVSVAMTAGTGDTYGLRVLTSGSTGADIGVLSLISDASGGIDYAGHFGISTSGSGDNYGIRSYIDDGSLAGTNYALAGAVVAGTTNSDYAGYFSIDDGNGGNDYVIYANPVSDVDYGLYVAGGATSYAGYFDGSVYIDNQLGIGSAPSYELHVSGDAYVTSGLGVGVAETDTGHLYVNNVAGINAAPHEMYGIRADNSSTTNSSAAVYGVKTGAAVTTYGGRFSNSGATTTGYGVFSESTSTGNDSYGVYGSASTAADNSYGVYGYASRATSANYGVYGRAYRGDAIPIYGIYGQAHPSGTTTSSYGGYFESDGTEVGSPSNAYGVYSVADTADSTAYGIYAAASNGATNWAGYFDDGDVYIENDLGINISAADPSYAIHAEETFTSNPTGGDYIIYASGDTGADLTGGWVTAMSGHMTAGSHQLTSQILGAWFTADSSSVTSGTPDTYGMQAGASGGVSGSELIGVAGYVEVVDDASNRGVSGGLDSSYLHTTSIDDQATGVYGNMFISGSVDYDGSNAYVRGGKFEVALQDGYTLKDVASLSGLEGFFFNEGTVTTDSGDNNISGVNGWVGGDTGDSYSNSYLYGVLGNLGEDVTYNASVYAFGVAGHSQCTSSGYNIGVEGLAQGATLGNKGFRSEVSGNSNSDFGMEIDVNSAGAGSDYGLHVTLDEDSNSGTDYVGYFDPEDYVEYGVYVNSGATTDELYVNGTATFTGNISAPNKGAAVSDVVKNDSDEVLHEGDVVVLSGADSVNYLFDGKIPVPKVRKSQGEQDGGKLFGVMYQSHKGERYQIQPGEFGFAFTMNAIRKVNVSGENGNIAVGDKLSLSNIPGHVKKADPGENTLGLALKSHNSSGTGQIPVFVQLGYNNQTVAEGDGGKIETGRIAGDLGIKGNLVVGGDVDVAGTIKASSIWSQNATWHIDSQGELFVQNIQTQDLEIAEGKNKALGESSLPAGSDEIFIENESVTNKSRILITFDTDYSPASRFWISEKRAGEGFKLQLDEATSANAAFQWLIIN